MGGDTIHGEEATQICGKKKGFRIDHIDLEKPHPSGMSIKQFEMQICDL